MEVSFVLPCRNEVESIGVCIKSIHDVMKPMNIPYEIIVSDSSNDNSDQVAVGLKANVVKHNKIGYGAALLEGFKVASGRIIIMADADSTYNFYEVPKFLEAIKKCDLVIGNRFKGHIKDGSMPFLHRYIGNPLLSTLLRIFFRTPIQDSHSGFRAIRKSSLDGLNLKSAGMEFASEMIIKASKKGYRIREIPIDYFPRIGTSKMNSFKDGWQHLRFMLLFSPLWVFIIPSIMLVAYGLFRFDIAGLVILTFGYQIFMLGLFAKTYAITRMNEKDVLTEKIIQNISLGKGLLLAVLFGGLAYFFSSGWYLVILLMIAILTFFNVFFLSILGIQEQ